MLTTHLPRVFDLVDNGDGVSWVPYDHLTPGDAAELLTFPALDMSLSSDEAAAGVSLYRVTAERRVERRKRQRPRKLDLTA